MVLLALVACQNGDTSGGYDGLPGSGGGSGSGSEEIDTECTTASDCGLAGSTCCECPSFAVNVADPAYAACEQVQCTTSCPANVLASTEAACESGHCVLECAPMACTTVCATGYAIDPTTGCLSCSCAGQGTTTSPPACSEDSDCVRTPADCCGCTNGGQDTAVLASDQASYQASLNCPPDPSCPGGDPMVCSCAADLSPRCIEGMCELAPPTPAGACGQAGLPACATGQTCTINVNPTASAQGVGVCM